MRGEELLAGVHRTAHRVDAAFDYTDS